MQCEASLHHHITSSHVFFEFHSSLFLCRCRRFSIKSQNFQSIRMFYKNELCIQTFITEILLNMQVKRRAIRVENFARSNFFILVVARELVPTKTSEFSKHISIKHYTCLIKRFTREVYST